MAKCFTILFTAGLLLLGEASLSHADILMWIDGVQGESKDQAHSGWNDVQSANWGHGEPPPGSAIKVQFQRLSVTMKHDPVSALLAQAAAMGTSFREIKLEMTIPPGPTQIVYSRVKLTGARVTSYQTSASPTSGNPHMDSITFGFDSITWIDFKVDETGRQYPGSSGCFILSKGIACTPTF